MDADRMAALLVAWLATYALHSFIVLTPVWLVTRLFAARFDRLSELMWKGAVCISVLAPSLQLLIPRVEGSPQMPAINDAIGQLGAQHIVGVGVPVSLVVAVLWITTVFTGIAQLLASRRTLTRLVSGRRSLSAGESLLLIEQPAMRISVSSALSVPVALHREVCLPEWALQRLSAVQLRAVIAHEIAHIERRDHVWRWIAAIASRVFFFQPLNWVAARRLRDLAECLCDEDAVVSTGAPVELASALGMFASAAMLHRRILVPSLASDESLTLRRVRRMLSHSPRARLPKRIYLGVAVPAATMVGLLAVFGPKMDVSLGPDMRYTVHAEDPAGPFTLTIDRGRVVAATIGGRLVPRDRVKQQGRRLEIEGDGTPPLRLTLNTRGGVTWMPRPARPFPL